jgi:hypothetical protein
MRPDTENVMTRGPVRLMLLRYFILVNQETWALTGQCQSSECRAICILQGKISSPQIESDDDHKQAWTMVGVGRGQVPPVFLPYGAGRHRLESLSLPR